MDKIVEKDIEILMQKIKNRKKKIIKYKKRIRKNSKKTETQNSPKKAPKKKTENIIIKKKVPCDYHKVGLCNKSSNCEFSHHKSPELQKDKLCKYHLIGGCQKNPCYFSHKINDFPCKYLFISGKCDKSSKCRFSHEGFKNEQQLINFIEENKNIIIDHLKNKIFVPVNLYALENKFVDIENKKKDEELFFYDKKEKILEDKELKKEEFFSFNPFN